MRTLGTLLREAGEVRAAAVKTDTLEGYAGQSWRTHSAAVGRILRARLPWEVRCDLYLDRSVGRRQMAATAIHCIRTAISPIEVPAAAAQAIAVAVDEIVRFVDSAVVAGEAVTIYVVLSPDGDDLIVGVGVEGAVLPAGTASATACLMRAAAIVESVGGSFQRGVDGDRMVAGMTFDRAALMRVTG